jgi:hypothetical protein
LKRMGAIIRFTESLLILADFRRIVKIWGRSGYAVAVFLAPVHMVPGAFVDKIQKGVDDVRYAYYRNSNVQAPGYGVDDNRIGNYY